MDDFFSRRTMCTAYKCDFRASNSLLIFHSRQFIIILLDFVSIHTNSNKHFHSLFLFILFSSSLPLGPCPFRSDDSKAHRLNNRKVLSHFASFVCDVCVLIHVLENFLFDVLCRTQCSHFKYSVHSSIRSYFDFWPPFNRPAVNCNAQMIFCKHCSPMKYNTNPMK